MVYHVPAGRRSHRVRGPRSRPIRRASGHCDDTRGLRHDDFEQQVKFT